MLDEAAKQALDVLRERVSSARGAAALKTVEEECAQGSNKTSGKPKQGFPREKVREYAGDSARGSNSPPFAEKQRQARG